MNRNTAFDHALRFAELHCLSNYSFLRGASHPEELVETAARLGYAALALTDECSLAGVVKAHLEARRHDLKLIIGSEFRLEDGLKLVLLATDREGYAQLSGLITAARMDAPKGRYRLDRSSLERHSLDHCLALWLPDETPESEPGLWLKERFYDRLWIGVELFMSGADRKRLNRLCRLGSELGLPLVACNDVHMHDPERRPLQDTLTAIRLNRPLSELGYALFPNGERYLRPLSRLARLYPPELLAETVRIAERCRFSLDELRYEYPAELVPEGHTPTSWLRHLTEEGLRRRWPDGAPDKVRRQIEHELVLIADLAYEPYFLTIHDIVRFARERGILCQGRGSAANSAVCYCLGITEVDPGRLDLLFERFISRERNEPPDIDVDFEHERREEVIQYIYRKYGRQRAALAASVITYRGRSAVRDVAKALGFSREQVDHLAGAAHFLSGDDLDTERLQAAGFDPKNPKLRLLAGLVGQLRGFPRHLSQHTGGFVIAADALPRLVPVENTAMPERTVIQWDKDDLEALGLLKVDVLALGMLTAIRKALTYVSDRRSEVLTLDRIPAEDPAVYAMLQRADSIGVFQVESRAQMAMLPRLKPENYYDLVIQVAIVRPGPIQGDMVHPYLARRSGREPVTYPGPEVEKVLKRTLGVPIFQEQVMQIAMVAAGFSAGEADQLRRAMAAWHRRGGLEKFERRLIEGMRERGYSAEFAEQIYRQIKGFGEYGFPESHSASFALLVYVSAWLKCHHPAAFTCALLNSQPMGFYPPAQLVQDARRHGVDVRPVDVRYSDYDCTLEGPPSEPPALRLGLRLVKGLSRQGAEAVVAARREKPFVDAADLIARAKLDRRDAQALAAADALHGLAGHRHRAFWDVSAQQRPTPLFGQPVFEEGEPLLRPPREGENIVADYASTGLTLRRHPLTLLRSRLAARRLLSAQELRTLGNGSFARTAGLVVCRQRPMTASGVVFLTLEDETGQTNVIVWPSLVQRQRHIALQAGLLAVHGTVQEEDGVLHLVAKRLADLSRWLGDLSVPCRDFY
ncbi:error-prone DNA polymerase [Methylocaldum szegediense]|uniref:Error-prone DNA polymerase n=1 Tax=Methylocaldum szegediense TaxID=73780 RepID=A0ABN8X2B0_9GAMM|nr:error-prone DNA polymerase [Methylocaldum szegediense]CAI8780190.1 Error-prone DNA polymerase [Methylocaldum szegediense]